MTSFHESKHGWNCHVSQFVTSPYSLKRHVWDCLALSAIAFDVVEIPLGVFEPPFNSFFMMSCAWAIRVYWNLDILSSFLTGYFERETVVTNAKLVAIKYLRSWFPFDVMIVGMD